MKVKLRFQRYVFLTMLFLLLFLLFLRYPHGPSGALANQLSKGLWQAAGIVAMGIAWLLALAFGVSLLVFHQAGYGWGRCDKTVGACSLVVVLAILFHMFFVTGDKSNENDLISTVVALAFMFVDLVYPFLLSTTIVERLQHQKETLYFWPLIMLLIIWSFIGAILLPFLTSPVYTGGEFRGFLPLGIGLISALTTLIGNIILKVNFDRAMAGLKKGDAETFRRLSSEGKRWFVRCQALHRLADDFTIGNRDAVMAALRDPDFRVRWQALRILDRLDREHAAAWLKEVEEDTNRLVQSTAAEIKKIVLEPTAQS